MTNVGKWETYYRNRADPWTFSNGPSFQRGAVWLADCATVEDWGAGGCWLCQFLRPEQRYIAVDGSRSPVLSTVEHRIADLTAYTSVTEGLFMRHLLEHNYDWPRILDNALASFTKRMVLAIFTPWATGDQPTVEMRFEDDFGVPTLQFTREAITDRLNGVTWTDETVASPSYYGAEHIFLIERT